MLILIRTSSTRAKVQVPQLHSFLRPCKHRVLVHKRQLRRMQQRIAYHRRRNDLRMRICTRLAGCLLKARYQLTRAPSNPEMLCLSTQVTLNRHGTVTYPNNNTPRLSKFYLAPNCRTIMYWPPSHRLRTRILTTKAAKTYRAILPWREQVQPVP